MADSNSFIRPDTFWHSLMLRANESVVHLGCGAGFYLIPAARIVGKKGKAIGVDILPGMLAEVENKANQFGLSDIITTYRANIENIPGSPVAEHSIDWVLIANILTQSNPSKVFAEAKRIVSMQGHVVVVGWDISASPFGPPNAIRLHKEEARQCAEQHGLVLTKEFSPSPYHYGLLLSPTPAV